MPHAADPHQPSSFGRGWIPASRDIGLPNDALQVAGRSSSIPLPLAGGGKEGVGLPLAGGGKDVGALPLAGGEDEVDGRTHPPLARRGPGGGDFLQTSALAAHHPQTPSSQEEGAYAPHPPALLHPNQFTPTRVALFLEHLSRHGQVRAAAQVAGVSAQTAYVRRRRDADFAAAWDAALILAREAAEQVLAERALHGTTETIWFRGEAVGERRRFDGRLLLAHLARLDARAAQAPAAVRSLADGFDDVLLALAGGEDTADAVALPGTPRASYIKAEVDRAEEDFFEAVEQPDDEADDAAWDAWSEARTATAQQARAEAAQTWDSYLHHRDQTLAALFGEGEEEDGEEERQATSRPIVPAQAGAHAAGDVGATDAMDPGLRREDGESLVGEEVDAPEPCKPRKPLSVLRCGTSASALLSAGLSWPLTQIPLEPRQPQAMPLPLPPAPAPPWLGAATGRSW